MTFEQFKIQSGSDSTGVATDMISVNSTVTFTYRNTGTFFGVHVSSTPLDFFGSMAHSFSVDFRFCLVGIRAFWSLGKNQIDKGVLVVQDHVGVT